MEEVVCFSFVTFLLDTMGFVGFVLWSFRGVMNFLPFLASFYLAFSSLFFFTL